MTEKLSPMYREVVLKHSAAPHVEFAKERLAEMNRPIPPPTAEDVAASEKLEGSRAQYTMQKRLELLVMRKPDTVTAAQIGDPPLEDPAPVLAPRGLEGDHGELQGCVESGRAEGGREAGAGERSGARRGLHRSRAQLRVSPQRLLWLQRRRSLTCRPRVTAIMRELRPRWLRRRPVARRRAGQEWELRC